ncbi:MAG TPA: hypothetical protein PLK94_10445 [Alphaproteobacteria bacterium]|nr:hypothetical protein [Alphaproteobacteria bacterium]HOO51693.1 hypothetical protein [Alphaproteobacteria bacterium]
MRNKGKIRKSKDLDARSVPVGVVIDRLLEAGFTCIKTPDSDVRDVRTSCRRKAGETARKFSHLAREEVSTRRADAFVRIFADQAKGAIPSDADRKEAGIGARDVLHITRSGEKLVFTGVNKQTKMVATFVMPVVGHMRGTELQKLLEVTGINLLGGAADAFVAAVGKSHFKEPETIKQGSRTSRSGMSYDRA